MPSSHRSLFSPLASFSSFRKIPARFLARSLVGISSSYGLFPGKQSVISYGPLLAWKSQPAVRFFFLHCARLPFFCAFPLRLFFNSRVVWSFSPRLGAFRLALAVVIAASGPSVRPRTSGRYPPYVDGELYTFLALWRRRNLPFLTASGFFVDDPGASRRLSFFARPAFPLWELFSATIPSKSLRPPRSCVHWTFRKSPFFPHLFACPRQLFLRMSVFFLVVCAIIVDISDRPVFPPRPPLLYFKPHEDCPNDSELPFFSRSLSSSFFGPHLAYRIPLARARVKTLQSFSLSFCMYFHSLSFLERRVFAYLRDVLFLTEYSPLFHVLDPIPIKKKKQPNHPSGGGCCWGGGGKLLYPNSDPFSAAPQVRPFVDDDLFPRNEPAFPFSSLLRVFLYNSLRRAFPPDLVNSPVVFLVVGAFLHSDFSLGSPRRYVPCPNLIPRLPPFPISPQKPVFSSVRGRAFDLAPCLLADRLFPRCHDDHGPDK